MFSYLCSTMTAIMSSSTSYSNRDLLMHVFLVFDSSSYKPKTMVLKDPLVSNSSLPSLISLSIAPLAPNFVFIPWSLTLATIYLKPNNSTLPSPLTPWSSFLNQHKCLSPQSTSMVECYVDKKNSILFFEMAHGNSFHQTSFIILLGANGCS